MIEAVSTSEMNFRTIDDPPNMNSYMTVVIVRLDYRKTISPIEFDTNVTPDASG